MFEGNISHIGKLGQYGPFEEVKVTATFGIYHKSVSGLLVGKETATFTMKVKSGARSYPKTDKKLAAWAAANGVDANDYKVMLTDL